MITLNYSTTINSSPEIVWKNLWGKESYKKWTAAFMEGSDVETSWQEGERIAFLGPDNNGMFGIIAKKEENKEMIFKHLGEIKNGVDEPKQWKNATEGYRLTQKPEGTVVDVIVTMDDENKEFQTYFDDSFPKALTILKQLSEN